MRHQELRISSLEGIGHFLNIVRWTGARDFASNTKGGVHCYWVPDGVLAEERDGVAFFETIAFHESRAEMRGGFFDFEPVQALFGNGVGVACELVCRESCYG